MRSVGVLITVSCVTDGLFDLHALPVGVELVRHHEGQGGTNDRAHLRAMRDDVDRPVGIDADEDIRMQGRLVGVRAPVAGFLRPQQLGHGLRAEYEGPGSGQPHEEPAAADVDDLAHAPPFAAALMAARIRW